MGLFRSLLEELTPDFVPIGPNIPVPPQPTPWCEIYQEVEYIQSGTSNEYINTGYKPNNNTRVQIDYDLVNSETWHDVFGTCGGVDGANKWFLLEINNLNGYYIDYDGTGTRCTTYAKGRHYVDWNGPTFIIDGSTYNITGYNTFTCDYNMHLVGASGYDNTHGGGADIKIYSCKIYNNGALVRDYVPWYRKSDGEIGLYDLENDVFYTNAGTGTFIKGSDVE